MGINVRKIARRERYGICMTKEVLIHIKGIRFLDEADEADEPVQMVTYGGYSYRDGVHYVEYVEAGEENEQDTYCTLRFGSEFFELKKKGELNVHMLFEVGRKHQTCYDTPMGGLLLGLEATAIGLQEAQECMDVSVSYKMEANGEYLAECDLSFHIESRRTTERAAV